MEVGWGRVERGGMGWDECGLELVGIEGSVGEMGWDGTAGRVNKLQWKRRLRLKL